VSYGGERGLLSVAFHPKFATNGKLYIDFTDNSGNTRIWELHARPGATKVAPGHRELLHIEQPYPNHNGGQLQFGPDGYLYIGMGDGGSADDPHRNGQNVGVLLAKLLRIDVDHRTGSLPYAIPPGNPFRSTPGARAEIYSFGLRNPWRFSFDRNTRTLYIGDVGQNVWEEVDALAPVQARGANFGWNAYEGDAKYIGALNTRVGHVVKPVQVYKHDQGCSVTGGYVYRGTRIPALKGVYLYSDYCQSHLWGFRLKGGAATGLVDWGSALTGVQSVVSFGEDRSGELYLTSIDGGVYKLVPR
jgi:glucose/arabinose dehydrogenase